MMQEVQSEQAEILHAVHQEITAARAFLRKAVAKGEAVAPRPVNRLLSIGVPVYNRQSETQDLIAVLCWQISQLDEDILIDVHDNGRYQFTIDFFNEVAKIFPFVRYRQSFCNVGADLNLSSLYMFSETPFRWIIGDDDLPTPGALKYIVDTIIDHADENVTVFHIGGFIVNERLDDILHDEILSSPQHGRGNHIFAADQSITTIGLELLRMSANIVKVLPLRDVVERHLVGLAVSPLCFNLNALTYGNCCFANFPLLVYREGDKSHWIDRWPRIAYYNVPRLFAAMALGGLLSPSSVDHLFNARPDLMFGDNAEAAQAFNHKTWRKLLAASDIEGAEASLARIDLMSAVLKEWANGRSADIDCLAQGRVLRPECIGEPAPDQFEIDERLMYVTIPADGGGGSAGFRFFGIPAFGYAVCDLQVWVRDDGLPTVVHSLGMRTSAGNGPFRQVAAMFPIPGRLLRYKVRLGQVEGPIDFEIRFTLDGKRPTDAAILCVLKRLVVSLSKAQGSD